MNMKEIEKGNVYGCDAMYNLDIIYHNSDGESLNVTKMTLLFFFFMSE